MAFGRTMTLFSEFSGTVTMEGKSVAGARVERRYVWHWKNKTGTESTTTDASGRFTFPAVTQSSFLGSLVPHEPVVEQYVVIHLDGREYLAYEFTKHNYDANGEFGGRKLNVTCELSDPEEYHVMEERTRLGYQGICRFADAARS